MILAPIPSPWSRAELVLDLQAEPKAAPVSASQPKFLHEPTHSEGASEPGRFISSTAGDFGGADGERERVKQGHVGNIWQKQRLSPVELNSCSMAKP